MKRVTLTDFSGGMNEAANPQLLPDNVFADILNYEYRGIEGLTKRYVREIEADLDALTDDEDNTIHPIQSMAVWHPSRMPEDAYDDKIYVIQANDRIVAYYRTSAVAWSKTLLATECSLKANYYVQAMRLLVADGVHGCSRLLVPKSGELAYGEIGLSAPLFPPYPIAESSQTYAKNTELDTGMTVEKGNILQYCYTVEDKYGSESNPSPICSVTEQVFKWRNIETGEAEYYWHGTSIAGMCASHYPQAIKDSLKYYNIYRRDIEFLEGTIATNFVLVYRLEIIDPDDIAVYRDTSNANYKDIAYTNTKAPIASDVLGINSAVFAIATSEKTIGYPFSFDHSLKIKINNTNNIDYVEAIVAIKLPKIGVGWNITDVFAWAEFPAIWEGNKVRLYFSDRMTPLPTMFYADGSSIYIVTKLPYLDRSRVTSIYLCWADASAGVTIPALDTAITGRWTYYDMIEPPPNFGATQKVFGDKYVANRHQLVSASYVGEWYYTGVDAQPNRANDARNSKTGSGWNYQTFPNVMIGGYSVLYGQTMPFAVVTRGLSGTIEYPILYRDNYEVYLTFTCTEVVGGAGAEKREFLRIELDTEDPPSKILYISDTSSEIKLWWQDDEDAWQSVTFLASSFYLDFWDGQEPIISLVLAGDGKCVATMWLQTEDGWYKQERELYSVGELTDDNNWHEAIVRFTHVKDGFATRLVRMHSMEVYSDLGTSTEEELKKKMLYRLANATYYREQIGADWTESLSSWVNNEITIEAEEIEALTSDINSVRWSDIAGGMFPALNFLTMTEPAIQIMTVSSFLKLEYQNTLVVFGRNTVSRLIFSDDLTQMASRADNIVEEFTYGGLYAPNSLVNTPFGLVWLSEAGLLLWSPEGVQPLTSGAIDLQHKGRPNDFYGAFYGMNNQYLLHDAGRNRTYAYHFEQKAWTRFDDMGFDNAVCLNLGSDYHNDLLLSDGEHVYRYPSLTTKAATCQLVTKKYTMDNVKPIRMRMMWNGTSPDSVIATTDNAFFSAGVSKTWLSTDWPENEIPRLKWIMFPLGFWGEYLQLTINNIEALTRLELDLKEGV